MAHCTIPDYREAWDATLQAGVCCLATVRRGVWMGMLLLWCAACIIVPIIQAEGIIAVFFPYLIRRPQVGPIRVAAAAVCPERLKSKQKMCLFDAGTF